ncbi:LytTR family transcriptional regulator [Flavobacterium sp. F372]|uniref:LytTR family transcriptional regulator n=1 Tax=Flavobacterium bernardetii TaxID=2813823 RepID=A0ABR7IY59_9FLAO|nr:LytTR family DNA-binding domain-containing protein [Flavobacterium bernardetii]MBC5834697.1 LytTR family transcriptional regulator [Flavobacterium bernardetii]NHF70345.1 LytTR family transcriptional regulator [Flavobacterium bernardetii]
MFGKKGVSCQKAPFFKQIHKKKIELLKKHKSKRKQNKIIERMITDLIIETELNQTGNNKIRSNTCSYCNSHEDTKHITKVSNEMTKFFQETNEFSSYETDTPNLIEQHHPVERDFVFIKLRSKYQKIMLNTILFIKSEKNYLNIKTTEKEYRFRSTIKDFIFKLPENFIQTHKSFIINSSKIENFNSDTITLIDNMKISISISCKKDVLIKLQHQLL